MQAGWLLREPDPGHTHRVPSPACLLALFLVMLVGLAGCTDRDDYRYDVCRIALPALEKSGAHIHLMTRPEDIPPGNSATLVYRLLPGSPDFPRPRNPDGSDAPPSIAHTITCHFAPATKPGARPELDGIETSRFGKTSVAHLALLSRFWVNRVGHSALQSYDRESLEAPLPVVPEIGLPAAFAVQLGIAGLSRGAIYGLLAMAFTLIYGLIGRINLALGELMMVAAVAAIVTAATLATAVGWNVPFLVGMAVLVSLIYGGGTSALSWRWVFGPLSKQRAGGQATLVASLGCLLFIQEFVRIAYGARDFELPPLWQYSIALLRGGGFFVLVNGFDLISLGLAVICVIALYVLMKRTRFGRSWQAISQDRFAAALCGVPMRMVEAQTFVLAGILCGLTGSILALRYGLVNFHSGTISGFKALTAAILGGIGRIRGAWLGGLCLGLLESYWSGYFGGAYRDVAVFGLLAIVLILRPSGLLGVDDRRDSLLASRNDHL